MAYILSFVLICTLAVSACADSGACALQKNDLWVCLGDSITHSDTYRRVTDRIIGHFHPEANIHVVNGGKSGALITGTAEEFTKAAANERPTVVSIMSAMNHSINSNWHRGMPMDPFVSGYITGLQDIVTAAKAKNMTVIVMSPTLTDESISYQTNWDLAGTREFLLRCTGETKALAKREGVIYLPVSEEMEAAQADMLPTQVFRPDGVHPSSLGEYKIAGTFYRHLRLDAPLSGVRKADTAPITELPVTMTPSSRFLQPGERKLSFNITTKGLKTVTATWTCRNIRRQETLNIYRDYTWTIELPEETAKLKPGEADDVMIDLTDGKSRNLYIVDLCATRVLHFVDGKVTGTLQSDEDRPEGKTVANWEIKMVDSGLQFDAEVFDSVIRSDAPWAWGNDGVTLWLDYRPESRFADIGVDSEVHQLVLGVKEKPQFGVSLIPWLGKGATRVATINGSKTAGGYKLSLLMDGNFWKTMDTDTTKRDFIGVNIAAVDLDADKRTVFTWQQKTQLASDQYANSLVILDLKNRFSGDSVTNVCVSKL